MDDFRKWGGFAAVIQALCFVVGFALYFTLLASANFGSGDIAADLTVLSEHRALMQAWNFIIYVVFGIFLVVLTLALYDRMKSEAPAIAQVAAVVFGFGLIVWLVWIGVAMLRRDSVYAPAVAHARG